jgi:hypothetical protein
MSTLYACLIFLVKRIWIYSSALKNPVKTNKISVKKIVKSISDSLVFDSSEDASLPVVLSFRQNLKNLAVKNKSRSELTRAIDEANFLVVKRDKNPEKYEVDILTGSLMLQEFIGNLLSA